MVFIPKHCLTSLHPSKLSSLNAIVLCLHGINELILAQDKVLEDEVCSLSSALLHCEDEILCFGGANFKAERNLDLTTIHGALDLLASITVSKKFFMHYVTLDIL